MRNKLGLLGLVSLLVVGCAAPATMPEEDEGETSNLILNGQVDTQTNVVGFVRMYANDGTNFGVCSGTLIAPRVVLTAAHCAFNGLTPISNVDVSFSPQAANSPFGQGAYHVGRIIPNPRWDHGTGNGQDVSAIVLDQPITNVRPAGLGAAPGVGATVIAEGYGRTVQSADGNPNDGTGARRMVKIAVTAVNAREITAGSDAVGTCHGDSGGPLVFNGRLVGTVSYGDTADCHGSSHFTRVDDSLPFINSILAQVNGGSATPTAPSGGATPSPGTGAGGGGRASSGGACCYNGEYFACSDSAACFGGFDVNACIASCNGEFNCTMACVNKMSTAGAPTSACQRSAPPPGVMCGG